MNIMMAYFANLAEMSGGLERTLCQLSNALNERGHNILIAVYNDRNAPPFYPLNSSIRVIDLNNQHCSRKLGLKDKISREWYRLWGKGSFSRWKGRQRAGLLPRFRALYEEEQPDIILSFNHQTSGELYEANIHSPVISLFRNDPDNLCPQMSKIEKAGVEHSACIQVLLPYFAKSIKKYINNSHIMYIPNAIPQFTRKAYDDKEKTVHTILNVARINPKQKRQHLLVEGFARIAPKYPEWNLKIWGGGNEGKYVEKMKKFIHSKNLDDRILFMGRTHQVENEYYKADIFGFPSSYEGFPNALGEAMSSGLPSVVCSDCTSTCELISNGYNGLIAEPSPEDIARKLECLIQNKKERIGLGKAAALTIKEYSPNKIWNQWDDVIKQVVQEYKSE